MEKSAQSTINIAKCKYNTNYVNNQVKVWWRNNVINKNKICGNRSKYGWDSLAKTENIQYFFKYFESNISNFDLKKGKIETVFYSIFC